MTHDRMADGYEPNWDIDSAVGRQGEFLVADIVEAMKGGASIEIKTDDAASKWGRVYMEYECLYGYDYRPTCIAETSAELWATVLAGQVVVCAPTWRYRQAARRAWRSPGLRKNMDRGSHPTHGVVIPLGSLLSWLMEAEPLSDPARPQAPPPASAPRAEPLRLWQPGERL